MGALLRYSISPSQAGEPGAAVVHSGLSVVNISRDRTGRDGTGHDRVHAHAGRKAELGYDTA